MKHAAEVPDNVYCSKCSTPSGVWYHFSTSKRPPSLIRITKVIWYTSPNEYTFLGERHKRLLGEEVTIWQRGWRYIKGARKIARQRRKLHDLHKFGTNSLPH